MAAVQPPEARTWAPSAPSSTAAGSRRFVATSAGKPATVAPPPAWATTGPVGRSGGQPAPGCDGPVARLPAPRVSQPSAAQVMPEPARMDSEPTAPRATSAASAGVASGLTWSHRNPGTPTTTTGPRGVRSAGLAAAAPADRTPRGPVVVVGVPGLRWDQVSPDATPALAALVARGAVGSLSIRAGSGITCAADGWLTLGAGNRATGPSHPGAGCPPDLPTGPVVAQAGGRAGDV